MKSILQDVLVAATCVASGAGFAADLGDRYPTKAPPALLGYVDVDAFSGFYLGGAAGYGWDTSGQDAFINSNNFNQFIGSLGSSSQGFVGSGYFGVGKQFNMFYLGAETDISVAALNGTASMPGLITAHSRDDWFGTVRARVGWIPVPHLMVYGTGGFAYGDFSNSFTLGNAISASGGGTQTGWAWGLGGEVALAKNWLARIEYQRVTAGHTDATFTQGGASLTLTKDNQVDIVRAGVAYRFN